MMAKNQVSEGEARFKAACGESVGELINYFKCPQKGCSFGTNDLGLFVEHISSMPRDKFLKKLIIERDLVSSF
jgi:hypothetical protein